MSEVPLYDPHVHALQVELGSIHLTLWLVAVVFVNSLHPHPRHTPHTHSLFHTTHTHTLPLSLSHTLYSLSLSENAILSRSPWLSLTHTLSCSLSRRRSSPQTRTPHLQSLSGLRR